MEGLLRAPNKWLPMSSCEAGKKLTFKKAGSKADNVQSFPLLRIEERINSWIPDKRNHTCTLRYLNHALWSSLVLICAAKQMGTCYGNLPSKLQTSMKDRERIFC
jgi:hypothetical protein